MNSVNINKGKEIFEKISLNVTFEIILNFFKNQIINHSKFTSSILSFANVVLLSGESHLMLFQ